MSTAQKYRRQPSGEWLGYPELKLEDIEHESFKFTKYVSQAMVDNRKGRVYILMEHDFYQRFLKAVRKKFGNISHVNVEKAALEAVKTWIEAVAMKANRSDDAVRIMKEWTEHYYGKVIQFETDTEQFYLVVSNGRMKVKDGIYPAPDLTFKGSSKTISDVFTGRKRIVDAMKTWELVLIGAGHEGFTLGRLITTVMLEV